MGQEFVNENKMLFAQYSKTCNFEFKLASEIEKQPKFEDYYQKFQHLYQTSQSFNNLANTFAESYLSRRKDTEKKTFLHKQKQLAITYLLEESALFTYLAQNGYPIFVYPGSIRTFEEIAEGLHPQVPSFLQQIIWISLRLKKKKSET